MKSESYYQNLAVAVLDIIGNIVHDIGGNYFSMQLLDGSNCNVYHNTIVGNADGNGGPKDYGPGDGLHVDATSAADVRNNIFYRLPFGISMDEGALVTASTNLYYMIIKSGGIIGEGGVIGNDIIFSNPYLAADFSMDQYSPGIDAAELILGVNDEFSGNGPDIGAMESEGPRGELSWITPQALVYSDLDNPEDLIDDDLTTGLNRRVFGSYMVLDISDANGEPSLVYGMRFFAGSTRTVWRVYVSDNPEGPWEPVLVDHGWDVEGDLSPGVWDEKMVDFFYSGKYMKVARRFGPYVADCVFTCGRLCVHMWQIVCSNLICRRIIRG